MDLLGAPMVLLVVCLIFFLIWNKERGRRQNLPPGPTILSLIGSLLQLQVGNIVETLRKMSEKYGPIFTLSFGAEPMVFLYGYDILKKALVEHGDLFLDRSPLPSSDKTSNKHGITMSSGERWVQMQQFFLATLKNVGMGKKKLEEWICEEAEFLVEEIRAKQVQPFNPTLPFSCATGNIMNRIVFGERCHYQDQKYIWILQLLTDILHLQSSITMMLYNLFPRIMDYLPGPHQTFFTKISHIHDFLAQKVKEHMSTLDPSSEPRDFIDTFLLKMEQEKSNPRTEFTMENLIMAIMDIFFPGTQNPSNTLRYITMILVEHPEVEAKIHEEIDQVIGRERAPAMKDQLEMPYTEAVLHEAQRFLDLIIIAIPRSAKRDLELGGFTIPKGTSVYPVLSSALHDPKQFKNPDQFDPEHFLDEKGHFKKNVANIPFAAGKRSCPGEGLARMELFLFLTSILQNFRLKYPPGITKVNPRIETVSFINIPREVPLCFSPR